MLFFHNSNDGMPEKPEAKKDLIKEIQQKQLLFLLLLSCTDNTHMLNIPHSHEDAQMKRNITCKT